MEQSMTRMRPPAAASPCVTVLWTTTRCMMRLRRARPDHPRPPARVRLGAVALRPRMMQSSCTRHRRHRQRAAAADRSPCICGWALASEHVTRRGEDARSVRSHTHPCFSIAAINRHCQNVSCCGVARSSESEASYPTASPEDPSSESVKTLYTGEHRQGLV